MISPLNDESFESVEGAQREVESFGDCRPRFVQDETAKPFAFSTNDFDAEAGLMYYDARQYDPSPGRFLSTDPAGYEELLTPRHVARQRREEERTEATTRRRLPSGLFFSRLNAVRRRTLKFASACPLRIRHWSSWNVTSNSTDTSRTRPA